MCIQLRKIGHLSNVFFKLFMKIMRTIISLNKMQKKTRGIFLVLSKRLITCFFRIQTVRRLFLAIKNRSALCVPVSDFYNNSLARKRYAFKRASCEWGMVQIMASSKPYFSCSARSISATSFGEPTKFILRLS